MSEYICTVNTSVDILTRLTDIFNKASNHGLSLTAGTQNVFLHSSNVSKPINNILIKDGLNGSWLALIGMPLTPPNQLNSEDGIAFMQKFFDDPLSFLKHQVDGHFALIGYDAIQEKSFFASDFNSFIPLFYANTSKGFIVSSSELVLAKTLQSKIDEEGLWQTVNLGVTWGNRTRFENIKKLLPCELLIYDKKGLVKQRYWRPEEEQQWEGGDFEKIVTRWKDILKSSVESFANQSVPSVLSSDLTGGEDSRLLVAQCHDLKLPLTVRVAGFPGSEDIQIASKCASMVGLDLKTFIRKEISEQLLIKKAFDICLSTDGYGSFFSSCVRYSSNEEQQPLEYSGIHLCGVPGGEAYRGVYYQRAKLLFPSMAKSFNERAFINLKFMLDYLPGLFDNNDSLWKENIYATANKCLENVRKFPAGTQVDHLMREFQTCLWGLSIRQPFYLPLGLKDITRSIYQIMPHHKQNGKLTRAVTEDLFPELALLKTQSGVPTLRWRFSRAFLFWPGYITLIKKVVLGFRRRVLKITLKSKTLSKHHRLDLHEPVMKALLNSRPYSNWFESTSSMVTGRYYNSKILDSLLSNARQGQCKSVRTLGRIINQELAYRFVTSGNNIAANGSHHSMAEEKSFNLTDLDFKNHHQPKNTKFRQG